jgi:hypothetical protein
MLLHIIVQRIVFVLESLSVLRRFLTQRLLHLQLSLELQDSMFAFGLRAFDLWSKTLDEDGLTTQRTTYSLQLFTPGCRNHETFRGRCLIATATVFGLELAATFELSLLICKSPTVRTCVASAIS